MPQITLNGTSYQTPSTKAEFTELVGQLSAHHPGLRENVVMFFMSIEISGSFSRGEALTPLKDPRDTVASVVAEGKFGTLHLLFETLGRPDFSEDGFSFGTLSGAQVEALLAAYNPFVAEADAHPNVAFLLRAKESGRAVTVGILGNLTDERKSAAAYLSVRTNLLFELFNSGVLRGSDGNARKAILDSFSTLPNAFLTAGGSFADSSPVSGAKGAASHIRAGVATSAEAPTAIDKFPSLMAARGAKLMADGNRIVPGVMIRDGVHIGKRNIFMFHAAVNIAAFIGDDNLIDSHASIASAAQIGNKNKIGSFVSLEGVLSPANAQPVLIGDENFIGSFARIGTGITLGNRNFIGAGVNISKGTKLKDCRDGSPSKGSYLNVQELNGAFNNLAIAPNNAVRVFNEISLVPGEYILFENSEEFMARFEGDDRIKAKN